MVAVVGVGVAGPVFVGFVVGVVGRAGPVDGVVVFGETHGDSSYLRASARMSLSDLVNSFLNDGGGRETTRATSSWPSSPMS